MLNKKTLRSFYRVSRLNKTFEARELQSSKVIEHLVAWLTLYEEKVGAQELCIGLYHPLALELQITQNAGRAGGLPKNDRWHYYLPVVTPHSRVLSFHPWELDQQALEEGAFGIQQPRVLLPKTQEILPDVVVVPMVAYGFGLERLGYGGGYYDHTFDYFEKQCGHQPMRVGVCFSMHRLPDDYKRQPHDYDMDVVITDEGILDPKRKIFSDHLH